MTRQLAAQYFTYWLLAQYLTAACLYFWVHDYPRAWYWLSAMALNASILFMR